jgi:hypothetical protein
VREIRRATQLRGSENFRRPKLAEDFATVTDSDKEIEMELYRRRQVHYFYVGHRVPLTRFTFTRWDA